MAKERDWTVESLTEGLSYPVRESTDVCNEGLVSAVLSARVLHPDDFETRQGT